MTSRKNQKNMSSTEWSILIDCINKTHGVTAKAPRYRDFVKVHVHAMSSVGMSWHVHTMSGMGMVGTNFLSWHRWWMHSLLALDS